MVTNTLKISSQGQITIPKNVRDSMGIVGGSEFIVMARTESPQVINIYPKVQKWVDVISGIAEGAWGNNTRASTKYVRDLRNEWANRPLD